MDSRELLDQLKQAKTALLHEFYIRTFLDLDDNERTGEAQRRFHQMEECILEMEIDDERREFYSSKAQALIEIANHVLQELREERPKIDSQEFIKKRNQAFNQKEVFLEPLAENSKSDVILNQSKTLLLNLKALLQSKIPQFIKDIIQKQTEALAWDIEHQNIRKLSPLYAEIFDTMQRLGLDNVILLKTQLQQKAEEIDKKTEEPILNHESFTKTTYLYTYLKQNTTPAARARLLSDLKENRKSLNENNLETHEALIEKKISDDKNSLGNHLLTQLNDPSMRQWEQGFASVREIAQKMRLEQQKKFIAGLVKAFYLDEKKYQSLLYLVDSKTLFENLHDDLRFIRDPLAWESSLKILLGDKIYTSVPEINSEEPLMQQLKGNTTMAHSLPASSKNTYIRCYSEDGQIHTQLLEYKRNPDQLTNIVTVMQSQIASSITGNHTNDQFFVRDKDHDQVYVASLPDSKAESHNVSLEEEYKEHVTNGLLQDLLRTPKEFVAKDAYYSLLAIEKIDHDHLLTALDQSLNEVIKFYGEDVFLQHVTEPLKKLGLELKQTDPAENIKQVKAFLAHDLLVRKFALQNNLFEASFFKLIEERQNYPASLYHRNRNSELKPQSGIESILTDMIKKAGTNASDLRDLADRYKRQLEVLIKSHQDDPKLIAHHQFLQTLLANPKYNFNQSADRGILLQACDTAHGIIKNKTPMNPDTLESIKNIASAPYAGTGITIKLFYWPVSKGNPAGHVSIQVEEKGNPYRKEYISWPLFNDLSKDIAAQFNHFSGDAKDLADLQPRVLTLEVKDGDYTDFLKDFKASEFDCKYDEKGQLINGKGKEYKGSGLGLSISGNYNVVAKNCTHAVQSILKSAQVDQEHVPSRTMMLPVKLYKELKDKGWMKQNEDSTYIKSAEWKEKIVSDYLLHYKTLEQRKPVVLFQYLLSSLDTLDQANDLAQYLVGKIIEEAKLQDITSGGKIDKLNELLFQIKMKFPALQLNEELSKQLKPLARGMLAERINTTSSYISKPAVDVAIMRAISLSAEMDSAKDRIQKAQTRETKEEEKRTLKEKRKQLEILRKEYIRDKKIENHVDKNYRDETYHSEYKKLISGTQGDALFDKWEPENFTTKFDEIKKMAQQSDVKQQMQFIRNIVLDLNLDIKQYEPLLRQPTTLEQAYEKLKVDAQWIHHPAIWLKHVRTLDQFAQPVVQAQATVEQDIEQPRASLSAAQPIPSTEKPEGDQDDLQAHVISYLTNIRESAMASGQWARVWEEQLTQLAQSEDALANPEENKQEVSEEAKESVEPIEKAGDTLGDILIKQLTSEDPDERKQGFDSIREIASHMEPVQQYKFLSSFVQDLKLSDQEEFKALEKMPKSDFLTKGKHEKHIKKKKGLAKAMFEDLSHHVDAVDRATWEKNLRILFTPPEFKYHIGLKTKKSPKGVSTMFDSPVPTVTDDSTKLGLTKQLRDNTTIENSLFVSLKSGGANAPGALGGNYLRCYLNKDGKVCAQKIFYKQATDDNEPNHRENMAEVIGGQVMNQLGGDNIASTFFVTPNEHDKGNPAMVYVASVWFDRPNSVHRAAHEKYVEMNPDSDPDIAKNKRAKGKYAGQAINDKYLGSPHFQEGLTQLTKDVKADSLGKALMASMLLGNYQNHTENVLVAQANGEQQFVVIDFGGAYRRWFQPSGPLKSKEVKEAYFEKSFNPEQVNGRKYNVAYYLAYSEDVRKSSDYIKGMDEVADYDKVALAKAQNDAVDYAIQFYGAKAFLVHFAKELDTTGKLLNLPDEKDINTLSKTQLDKAVQTAKDFLVHTLLARQYSLQAYSLNVKRNNRIAVIPDSLRLKHPVSFYRDKDRIQETKVGPFEQKLLGMIDRENDNITALTSRFHKQLETLITYKELLNPKDLANVDLQFQFLHHALYSGQYDFKNENDIQILIQACDTAYRTLVEVIDQLPTNIREFIEEIGEKSINDVSTLKPAEAIDIVPPPPPIGPPSADEDSQLFADDQFPPPPPPQVAEKKLPKELFEDDDYVPPPPTTPPRDKKANIPLKIKKGDKHPLANEEVPPPPSEPPPVDLKADRKEPSLPKAPNTPLVDLTQEPELPLPPPPPPLSPLPELPPNVALGGKLKKPAPPPGQRLRSASAPPIQPKAPVEAVSPRPRSDSVPLPPKIPAEEPVIRKESIWKRFFVKDRTQPKELQKPPEEVKNFDSGVMVSKPTKTTPQTTSALEETLRLEDHLSKHLKILPISPGAELKLQPEAVQKIAIEKKPNHIYQIIKGPGKGASFGEKELATTKQTILFPITCPNTTDAKAMLAYAYMQVELLVKKFGPKTMVEIFPVSSTADPKYKVLATAYIAICEANGITYQNNSGCALNPALAVPEECKQLNPVTARKASQDIRSQYQNSNTCKELAKLRDAVMLDLKVAEKALKENDVSTLNRIKIKLGRSLDNMNVFIDKEKDPNFKALAKRESQTDIADIDKVLKQIRGRSYKSVEPYRKFNL